MKTCNLCKKEITSYQSYNITGTGAQHLACQVGRDPASHPTAHYSHSNTVFNKEDLRRKQRMVSDEGMVFDE